MTVAQDFDLVIRRAKVATASDIFEADLGIRGGRIVAIADRLAVGREEIDAEGRWVTPGGVDAHCHLAQPMNDGSVMADNFETGTRSAACGGTTTVIPFAAQQKGGSVAAAVRDYHSSAEGQACVDYAFHLIVSDLTPEILTNELPQLIKDGYTSFKVYMTYDDMKLSDYQILDVLALARREGALTMLHAENADCIAWLTQQLLARGHAAPRFHALSRPPVVEKEATFRAIALAELLDTPILIVHVSSPEATEQIRMAQTRGLRVFAETCPQYLFLTADNLDDPEEGLKCICSPPPRDARSQEAIWEGICNGTFQVFSSDHAPFRFEGAGGKQQHGSETEFPHVPNGIPGLETRMPLLFSQGVLARRIDINRFVALTATDPAKLYGLYPRKGTIAIGSDADLVIWDTSREVVIRNDNLHHNVDYTPYEGMSVRAWPALTLSRGIVVYRDGVDLTRPGHGRFLPCDPPPAMRRNDRHQRLFPWLDAIGIGGNEDPTASSSNP